MDDLKEKLDNADRELTNFPDIGEALTSAVEAARSAINAARAILLGNTGVVGEGQTRDDLSENS